MIYTRVVAEVDTAPCRETLAPPVGEKFTICREITLRITHLYIVQTINTRYITDLTKKDNRSDVKSKNKLLQISCCDDSWEK